MFVDYPFLEHSDPKTNLERITNKSKPDLIGIGIRNLDTAFSHEPFGDYDGPDIRTFYFLPHVQRMVKIIKNILPQRPIILGGGRIYQGTLLSRIAEKENRHLSGRNSEGYLDPCYYCSPESPLKLKKYVEYHLPFSMDYKPVENEMSRQTLGAAYLVVKKGGVIRILF